ncbi:MAG: tail fiber domain-containing protein [Bacteroidales bacterium]
MKRLLLFLLTAIVGYSTYAQTPQGFSYQAVARDTEGNILGETTLTVKLSILSGSDLIWQERHAVQTNGSGLFSLVIGSESATRTGGSAALFSDISWSGENYELGVVIDRGQGEVELGSAPIMSVPYALHAQSAPDQQSLSLSGTMLNIERGDGVDLSMLQNGESGWTVEGEIISTDLPVALMTSDPQVESPLFEVRNDAGNPVFSVYNDGVMVYVDEDKKGVKGGFAVGGYSSSSKGVTQEYLRITPDSVRVYVPESSSDKGVKGGFAVGGYNKSSKSTTKNFLEVTSANTSIFFDTTTRAKGFKGGFAVGGYSSSKAGEPDQLLSLTRSNYLIGQDAGLNITTGKNNTFFGWKAGLNNTTGDENIFVGKLSGFSNLDAVENIFIGNESGYSTESGYGNIYLGNQSGYYNTDGFFNSIIGYQAGFGLTSSYNTFLGYQAGGNSTTGENNIAIGFQAGLGFPTDGAGVTGIDNVFIGNSAGAYNTTGSSNIMVGNNTGYSNTTGENNVFIGNDAGYSNNMGFNNVMIGFEAGYSNYGLGGTWDGNYNVFLGHRAGYYNTSGSGNVFLGYFAGNDNESGDYQTIIGHAAGAYSTGEWNTFVGAEAGIDATTGTYNTYIGIYTGRTGIGDYNTYLGYAAGYTGEGYGNVLLGASAGYGTVDSAFNYNTYIGTSSGVSTTTGSDNVFVGYQAGYSTTTGSGNVFIGSGAGYNEIGSNKLYIANNSTDSPLVYGDFGTSELTITGNAGINYPGTEEYGLIVDVPSDQTPQYYIYSFGDMYTDGTLFEASDIGYKKNVVNVDNALSKLQKLNGVYFDYTGTKSSQSGENNESIGVIAQDVEKVFPELVRENIDGMKAVNYSGLIPVLIEAIKDQQMQIEAQQQQINTLKEKVGGF